MPTNHVTPDADDRLQAIADAIFKSKKVVVVTGAGISTNSGIPDFRSENGLYSLIQAQFDAAARRAESKRDEDADIERPAKRRKISVEEGGVSSRSSAVPEQRNESRHVLAEPSIRSAPDPGMRSSPPRQPSEKLDTGSEPKSELGIADLQQVAIEQLALTTTPHTSPPTSPRLVSQSPTSKFRPIIESTGLATPPRAHSAKVESQCSSSPLSSPPPVLFDPYEPQSDSTAISSNRDSSSDGSSRASSESPPSSIPFNLSQGSSSRVSLPNMKGRDLFDASIWADPIKTSVFYTFASTLRQKVRSVEPTTSHHFIGHLRDTGRLVRCYTQNIDQIEEKIGLTTELGLGPGSRGRFSTKSTRSSLAAQASTLSATTEQEGSQSSQADQPPSSSQPSSLQQPSRSMDRGVECVFLHGSLHALRCFRCGSTCDWDACDRENETLSGRQPPCPSCEGATAARQERGKRALGVGKLRPDIVLYGEEHPNSHLISPIVQHDLSLNPDMLLILGTSLRVHGLKYMVKEFANAVHHRGGTVVFVNFTKPPESVWSDVIDHWIQWDCDTWVQDLKGRKPAIWNPEEAKPKAQPRRQANKAAKDDGKATKGDHIVDKKPGKKTEKAPKKEVDPRSRYKPDAKRPQATRDHKGNGAYLTWKILEDLSRITDRPKPEPMFYKPPPPAPKVKRNRKSAPAALESQPLPMDDQHMEEKSLAQVTAVAGEQTSLISIQTVPLKEEENVSEKEMPKASKVPISKVSSRVGSRASTPAPLRIPATITPVPIPYVAGMPRRSPAIAPKPSIVIQSALAALTTELKPAAKPAAAPQSAAPSAPMSGNSILDAVKANHRVRKRKTIDGEEIDITGNGGKRKKMGAACASNATPPQGILDGGEAKTTHETNATKAMRNPKTEGVEVVASNKRKRADEPAFSTYAPAALVTAPHTEARLLPIPAVAGPLLTPVTGTDQKEHMANLQHLLSRRCSSTDSLARMGQPQNLRRGQPFMEPPSKPAPLEPPTSPTGPLSPISPNMRSVMPGGRVGEGLNPFFFADPLSRHFEFPLRWDDAPAARRPIPVGATVTPSPSEQLLKETEAAETLSALKEMFLVR